jgi:hypothetical protein
MTQTLIATTTHGTPTDNYNGTDTSFFGVKSAGDGYYGYTDGLHTVAVFPNGFIGILTFQGTLEQDPASTDWVDIPGVTIGDGSSATSTNVTHNFTGNFTWIRTKVTSFTAGTLTKVQFNY